MSYSDDRDNKRRQLVAANIVFAADGLEEEKVEELADADDEAFSNRKSNNQNDDDVLTVNRNDHAIINVVEKNDERVGALHVNNPSHQNIQEDDETYSVTGGVCEVDDDNITSLPEVGVIVNENEDYPILSIGHPLNAFLVDKTRDKTTLTVANAVEVSTNRFFRPYLVITVSLICIAVIGVVSVSIYVSSTQGDGTTIPPVSSPTVSTNTNSNFACFESTGELQNATVGYVLGGEFASIIKKSYGTPIGSWCVDKIEDFSFLFCSHYYTCPGLYNPDSSIFNEDISTWNTSSATDMSYMFYGSTSFNQDISSWDVSSVINTSHMFFNATSFNQSLCSWGRKLNIGTKTRNMFAGADSCLTTARTNLTSTPPGPLCHPCT